MKPIGGFFELELPAFVSTYHPDAIALSTGRACLRLMIQHLAISKCYVPYYTCEAVYHPFQYENIPFEYYEINGSMDPKSYPSLGEGEYFLYINYFGVKSATVEELIKRYGDK